MRWLAEAGHECRVLTTARFETPVPFTIDHHLGRPRRYNPLHRAKPPRSVVGSDKRRGAGPSPKPRGDVARFTLDGSRVTLLKTRHNDEGFPALRGYLRIDRAVGRNPRPVRARSGHRRKRAIAMILLGLKAARERGIVTIYSVLRGLRVRRPSLFRARRPRVHLQPACQ